MLRTSSRRLAHKRARALVGERVEAVAAAATALAPLYILGETV